MKRAVVCFQKSLKCLKKILITKEDATIFIELTRTQTQEIVILLLVHLLSYFFVGCVYDFDNCRGKVKKCRLVCEII